MEKASDLFLSSPRIMEIVYGDKPVKNSIPEQNEYMEEDEEGFEGNEESEEDEEFFKLKTNSDKDDVEDIDSSKYIAYSYLNIPSDWKESEAYESLIEKFTKLGEGSLPPTEKEDELYGDFEDLETGQTSESTQNMEESQVDIEKNEEEERRKKKEKLKETFDTEYDEEGEKKDYYTEVKDQLTKEAEQAKAEFENMDEESRIQFEGFRVGRYVRIEIEGIPAEFIRYFNPIRPVLIGGLLPSEEQLAFIQVFSLFPFFFQLNFFPRFVSKSTDGLKKFLNQMIL